MRVAVLADIHGNLPALDAVLAEIEAAGVDAIVLNGDMATGPMPAQTLERLAGLGERAVWVRGNCERELAGAWDGILSPDLPEVARVPAEYCATQLDRAHRDLLEEDLFLRVGIFGEYQQRLRLNGVSAPRARCGRVPDDRREARLIWMSVATLVRLHAGKARLCGRSTGNPLSSP